MAARATRLGVITLELDDPVGGETRPPLRDKLLDAIDRLDAFGDLGIGVPTSDDLGLALHRNEHLPYPITNG
jgi:hypothetical protein